VKIFFRSNSSFNASNRFLYGAFAAALIGSTALTAPAFATSKPIVVVEILNGFELEYALAVRDQVTLENAGTNRGPFPEGSMFYVVTSQEMINGTLVTVNHLNFIPPNQVDPVIATIAPLGTNPINSVFVHGGAASSSDVFLVGSSDLDAGTFHAVRWALSDGVTRDLGTLLGSAGNSIAFGMSDDASTIIGWSNTTSATGPGSFPSGQHAFRWTQSTGMVDLGSLAGVNGLSFAWATNGDGSVVVGQTDMPNIGFITQGNQAFRWTQPTGMQALGTLQTGFQSVAYAVNTDGSVVVGEGGVATPTADGTSGQHAFRWTQATGMVDIGTLGTMRAAATSVSGDGNVVVGYADPGAVINTATGFFFSANSRAFRWTQATGIQDLNTLLTAAGVNMSGTILLTANTVTRDGQFIGGNASVAGATPNSYVLRYCDSTTTAACAAFNALVASGSGGGGGPSIAGLTTNDSVQASTDQLGDARLRLMAQQYGMTAELLGANERIGTGTEAGIYGSAGSVGAGAFGRIAFGNGFTLLSGLSYQDQTYQDIRFRNAGLGALALRYVYGASGWWRPFAEAGGWTSFDGAMTFSRNYVNGSGIAVGSASTSGGVSYAYGRLGAAFSVLKADEFAVSAEVGREWLRTGVYAEQLSSLNPFQGTALAATDTLDAVKLRAQYTHVFSPTVDATVWGAAATSFGRASPLQLMVPGIGTLSPTNLGEATWGEYGARIGYKISAALTTDAFIDGVAGNQGIGSDVHVGVDLRYRF
jgi:probable HAF family extracellular repeat protein